MTFSHIFEMGGEILAFREMRKRSGLTQAEVANRLGVDQTTVCKWENGKNLPRADLLPNIAELYGCTVGELLKRESLPQSESLVAPTA